VQICRIYLEVLISSQLGYLRPDLLRPDWRAPKRDTDMKDRRTTWRMVSAEYEACIVDNEGNRIAVQIADISEHGAKLVLSAPANSTQDFTLLLSPDGFIQRRCRRAWQSGDQIGVEFTEITHDERLYSEVDHLKLALTR
jgi:hypothetical protein